MHGWLHARWAAVRSLHRTAALLLAPYASGAPPMAWLYRAWGAKLGRGVLVDSSQLLDPTLLSVGHGTRLGREAHVSSAMVVPAGIADATSPALIFSPVTVGAGCQVGHKAVLPPGARLADGRHLKPRSAPSHKGAVGYGEQGQRGKRVPGQGRAAEGCSGACSDAHRGPSSPFCCPNFCHCQLCSHPCTAGPLADTPEFSAEEHLGGVLSCTVGIVAFVAHNVALLPGLTALFILMSLIFGQNAFSVLSDRLAFSDWSVGTTNGFNDRLAAWPCLFITFFHTLVQPLGAVLHIALLIAFKRLVLGSMPLGARGEWVGRGSCGLGRAALLPMFWARSIQPTLFTAFSRASSLCCRHLLDLLALAAVALRSVLPPARRPQRRKVQLADGRHHRVRRRGQARAALRCKGGVGGARSLGLMSAIGGTPCPRSASPPPPRLTHCPGLSRSLPPRRWLGAGVGHTVFLGGLVPALHDALVVGDLVSSGGESFVYCIDASGVVQSVTLDAGATLGNNAVLYPGARLHEGSLVGNDTVLAAGAQLHPRMRQQGSAIYTTDAGREGGKDLEGGDSKGGVAPRPEILVPRLHALRVLAAQLAVGPIEPLLRWAVPSYVLMCALEGGGAWVILVWPGL